PLIQVLITGIGWRSTYLVQAAFMAACMVPLAAVFRRAEQPATSEREVVAAAPAGSPMVAPRAGWTLGEAVRTSHFWLLFTVYLFTGLGSFFVSLHQLAFAADIGFDKVYAAGVLGMGAFLAVPGILVTGTLSDIIGREASAILAYGFSIFGAACALFI